jgi:hypothetical protein
VAWALWALAMLSLAAIWWLDHLLRQTGRPDRAPLGAEVVAPVLAAVSAGTIGAAILRYRLYDLDRIISRTLVYGLLTLLLAAPMPWWPWGSAKLLGQDSSLAVAGATLAVAAAFQPARRRIQQVVDRRFNRRRHDSAQTIEASSTRLRDELDLDTLSAELPAVVTQTMQPTQASMWLRPAPDTPSRLKD